MDLKALTPEVCKYLAEGGANLLRKKFDVTEVSTVLVLGSGWSGNLKLENPKKVLFSELPAFPQTVNAIEGHEGSFLFGEIHKGTETIHVICTNGRIHMNESTFNMERMFACRYVNETLIELGAKKVVITCSAGGLNEFIRIGDIAVADKLLTLFAGRMPLFPGEFVNPGRSISQEMVKKALNLEPAYGIGRIVKGCHSMIVGPAFETDSADKQALAHMGAHSVGMSTIPEVTVFSLNPKIEALCLSLIVDGPTGIMTHENTLAEAGKRSEALGAYLTALIKII